MHRSGRLKNLKVIGTTVNRKISYQHSDELLQEVMNKIKEDKLWATSSSSSKEIKCLFEFARKVPTSYVQSRDLNDYVSIKNKNESNLQNPPLIRSLSALLTFPLSLSYGLQG